MRYREERGDRTRPADGVLVSEDLRDWPVDAPERCSCPALYRRPWTIDPPRGKQGTFTFRKVTVARLTQAACFARMPVQRLGDSGMSVPGKHGFTRPRWIVSALLVAMVGAGLPAWPLMDWMNRIPNCTPAGDRWVPLFFGMIVALGFGLLVLIVVGFLSRSKRLKGSSLVAALGLGCMVVPMCGWLLAEYVLALAAGVYAASVVQTSVDAWRAKGNPTALVRMSLLGAAGGILCLYLILLFAKGISLSVCID